MKAIKIIMFVLLTGSMFFGCKKGDNDPFISLKTRKARLTGDWELVSGSVTKTTGTSTEVINFDGTSQTLTVGSTSNTTDYTESFTFESDGTYKYSSTDDGDTYDEEGAWTFGAKSTDLDVKAKETIILYCKKYTSNYLGNTYTYQYDGTNCPVYRYTLDMLKSDKMTILIDYTYTSSSSSYTKSGTMEYEKL